MPRNRPSILQPINQLDRAVMLNEKAGGDLSDRGLDVLRQAVNRQQELMLLRLQAAFLSRDFTKMKELPDLPPEFG
jgi:hypothetical protein